MLIQRSQIACEIEGTEGTAETLVAADVFLGFNVALDPDIEMNERNPVRSALSPYPSIPGKRAARLTFEAELTGGGAGYPIGSTESGVNNGLSDALRACGVSETLVGSTSATYVPASSSVPSVTLAWYMDGKAYKMWGTRGTCRIGMEAGKPPRMYFEFTGADFSETDVSLLSGTSLISTKPPIFASASLTIDSYAAIVSKLDLDLGAQLALRTSANAASGNLSAVIVDRKPILSFDPENVLVATEDFLGNWRSGTEMAFTTTLGSDAGNIIEITAPKVQYQEISLGEREGVSIYDLQGLCCLNSGDDEWQIQIT